MALLGARLQGCMHGKQCAEIHVGEDNHCFACSSLSPPRKGSHQLAALSKSGVLTSGIACAVQHISVLLQHLVESIPSEESLATFIFSFLKPECACSSNAVKVLLRDKDGKSLLA